MSKCAHNANITQFCLKPNCHYLTAGGCPICFVEDHPHPPPTEKIGLDQLQKLMKKYLFSKKVKPQCLSIQQSFYNYFKEMKTALNQIVNNIDELCKNVVNNIGFPYLSEHGYFKIYKRIKNNDLSKISPKELASFVKNSKEISQVRLTQEEQKLYLEQISKYFDMVNQIDTSLVQMHRIFQNNQIFLNHLQPNSLEPQNDNLGKLKEILEKVETETGAKLIKNLSESKSMKTESIEQSSKHHNGYKTHERVHIRPQPLDFKKIQTTTTKQTTIHHPRTTSTFKEKTEQSENSRNSQQKYKQMFESRPKQKKERDRKKSFNEPQINLIKVEEPKKEPAAQKNPEKKQRRERRNSIDNQLLFKQNNLEKKIAQMKKNRPEMGAKQQSECTQSSKEIMNYDLPQGKEESQEKISGPNQEFQVVPITRKLDDNVQKNQFEECHSPLLRKKILFESQKLKDSQKQTPSSTSSKTQNPYIVNTPLLSSPHGKFHKPESTLSKEKKLPELSQDEELSYMLLTKALSLNTEEAIGLLQKALQASENNLSAAQYLSFLYLQSYKYKQCLNLCKKYLRKLSTNKTDDVEDSILLFICNKSGAYNALGRYSETIKLINEHKGENQIILRNLANAYFCLGKYNDAIPLYEKALKDCNDDELYYNLSVCWYMKQDYTAAKFTLQSALNAQPKKQEYQQLEKQIVKHLADKVKLSPYKYKSGMMKKY